jgi:hypothetical protein
MPYDTAYNLKVDSNSLPTCGVCKKIVNKGTVCVDPYKMVYVFNFMCHGTYETFTVSYQFMEDLPFPFRVHGVFPVSYTEFDILRPVEKTKATSKVRLNNKRAIDLSL